MPIQASHVGKHLWEAKIQSARGSYIRTAFVVTDTASMQMAAARTAVLTRNRSGEFYRGRVREIAYKGTVDA